MAALNRQELASYEVHESVKVDTQGKRTSFRTTIRKKILSLSQFIKDDS
jgi:hypothetical protein